MLEAARRAKLDRFRRELKIEPYGGRIEGLVSLAEARAAFREELQVAADAEAARTKADPSHAPAEPRPVRRVAGRVVQHRDLGKLVFVWLRDHTGDLQVSISKANVGADAFELAKALDYGDILSAEGPVGRTNKGEVCVWARSIALQCKSLAPPPGKWHGLEDAETRYRRRYVDMWATPRTMATFAARSRIVSLVRRFMEDRGFLEVETPMMQPLAGGAAARPFVTAHNALDMSLFLRVAPELYLKRLLVGGMPKVFEINRNFRNEGVSTKHNPEFTMLEFYWAYATWEDLMDLTEALLREVCLKSTGGTTVEFDGHTLDFGAPFKRLSMAGGIAEATGLSEDAVRDPAALRARWLQDHPKDEKNPDLPSTMGKWFEWFFDEYVEPGLIQPTFITGYPTEISPLSRKSDADPTLTDRFEIFVCGMELGNGFNELNDPIDQQERFLGQVEARDAGDQEAMYFDADYIKALSYGMPPTAGEGIGIDRLVMLLSGNQSIRDVILFPTLKPRDVTASTDGTDGADGESTDGAT